MKLNNTSYVHKQIRLLCMQIELLTDMKLITDLGSEFQQIRFLSRLSYITIDYQHSACFVLAYDMTSEEWNAVQDIMIYCNWLELENKINKQRKTRTLRQKKKYVKRRD